MAKAVAKTNKKRRKAGGLTGTNSSLALGNAHDQPVQFVTDLDLA
jgi:hypothetical protein